jgi:hypothetical protein
MSRYALLGLTRRNVVLDACYSLTTTSSIRDILLLCSSVLSVIWNQMRYFYVQVRLYFVHSSESGNKNIPRQLLLLTTGGKAAGA